MGNFFMMRLLTLALAVGLAVGLAGCDSFDYHPYDVRVDGERNINTTNAAAIEPLQTGIYLTTVFSGHFWTRQPKRYPGGYYWFSTRLRPNIFIGQRATVHLPDSKRRFTHSISLFYEISCCDFMLIQRATNSSLKSGDYLTLSLGLQLTWL